MSDAETAHAYRGIVARSVVKSTNDEGGTQTATVITHRHVDRSDVEIVQPFGFASNAPAGGAMVVLAVGGDQGDLVGLPVAAPGSRLGKLKKGESAVYGAKGDRVHIKDDGSIEATSTKRVKSKVKTVTCEITEDRLVGTRRGWAGDALDALGRRIGSRLWLLNRAKQTETTRRFCEIWAAEALAWAGLEIGRPAEIEAGWLRRGVLKLCCSIDGTTVVVPVRTA